MSIFTCGASLCSCFMVFFAYFSSPTGCFVGICLICFSLWLFLYLLFLILVIFVPILLLFIYDFAYFAFFLSAAANGGPRMSLEPLDKKCTSELIKGG